MTATHLTAMVCSRPTRALAYLALAWHVAECAHAHNGRRFQVGLEANKLVAQGVITTGMDDGGGIVRPYPNVVHDHWSNSPLIGFESASSTLPGFDVPGPTPDDLRFHSLSLAFTSASVWLAPPSVVGPDTIPVLSPIDDTTLLSIAYDGQSISPGDGGALLLDPSISPSGSLDIDPLYAVNETPSNKLFVLELELRSSSTAVLPSDPIFVILSPDGDSPTERLHATSLFLENWLAARPIPEPTTSVLVALAVATFACRRTSVPNAARRVRNPQGVTHE